MAFKSVEQFNDDRYKNLFRITDDKKSADVVFLYRSKADMLVADVHYIKSADYSGYVHCCGEGCPACKKGIRVQTKLFIPVYNIYKNNGKGAIEFWDRTMRFEPQFEKDVFDNFPDPSEFVFRVTRHGVAGDVNTTYSIAVVGKNAVMSYNDILAKFNTSMPDHYENIVKSVSLSELDRLLQMQKSDNTEALSDYVPIPRAGYQSSIPDTYVNAADAIDVAPDLPAVEAPVMGVDSETDGEIEGENPGEGELPDPIF